MADVFGVFAEVELERNTEITISCPRDDVAEAATRPTGDDRGRKALIKEVLDLSRQLPTVILLNQSRADINRRIAGNGRARTGHEVGFQFVHCPLFTPDASDE